MDIVAACRAFVSVSDRGSFTVGAAAVGMQQSVASRRIAALEAQLGAELFDRTTRRSQLTPFGRGMLAAARQVVLSAAELEAQARRSRASVIRLAVPEDCSGTALGAFLAACRAVGAADETTLAPPADRAEAFAAGTAQAAVLTMAPEHAHWSVPLGVASAHVLPSPFLFATIRPQRADQRPPRRVLYEAEDDIPTVRDPLLRHRDTHALAPAQVERADSLPATVADVLSGDLLLCSSARAAELGFSWVPIAELRLTRSYSFAADDPALPERLGAETVAQLARALGVPR